MDFEIHVSANEYFYNNLAISNADSVCKKAVVFLLLCQQRKRVQRTKRVIPLPSLCPGSQMNMH